MDCFGPEFRVPFVPSPWSGEKVGQDDKRQAAARDQATETILTAHFLKSVCLEMGSVASSVTLLINWLASNQGTKITPGGIRFRPRVSTPRADFAAARMILISAPWLSPRLRASSAFMKQRAPGNAL